VLNFLEPFGITMQSFIPEHHLMLSTYGIISSLTMALIVYVIQPWAMKIGNITLDKGFNSILWLFMVVFLISLSNWLYSLFLHDLINGWKNMYIEDTRFMVMMRQFMLLYGMWGLVVFVNIYMLSLSKNNQSTKPQDLEETLLLHTDNQSDKFKVSALQLVCFKTCDNYLEVYYLDEANKLKNRMIRSSMKKIEEQLNESQFYRCHQSYLVNLAYVKGLKKVKNNHFLEVAYMDFDVTISRKNLKKVKSFLVG
jgi:hypothetical protein